jgi:4-amino-4-deoxy-L-arabinose transferase-like glycosyltransferase
MGMFKKISPLLLSLIVLVIFKHFVTTLIVPLWEFPDEQAHFAQLADYIETGLILPNVDPKKDLSIEVYESEKIMKTLRDSKNENYYVYRPQNKLPFSTTLTGPEENYLKSLPIESRKIYIKKEAARYPPLYYLIVGVGYRLTYFQDILIRVFVSRLISFAWHLGTLYFVYLLARDLFGKKTYLPLIFSAIVTFQPMYSFMASGINNDAASNFFGAFILWLSLDIIKHHLSVKKSLILGIAAGLGILSKPLIFPVILAAVIAIGIEWRQTKRKLNEELKILSPLVIGGLFFGGWYFLVPWIKTGSIPYFPEYVANSPLKNMSVVTYLKGQLPHYYKETYVWYWGIFKWLGIILPINLIRISKVVVGISLLGVVKFYLSKKTIIPKSTFTYVIIYSLTYFVALTLWDYGMVKSMGFSHGMQGRYFFPTLPAHLLIFLIGLISLVPKKLETITASAFFAFMLILNISSLVTLLNAYYQTSPLSTLFIQLSQYKPEIYKYPFSLIFIAGFLICLFIFCYQLIMISYKSFKKIKLNPKFEYRNSKQ